jgi:hypothetical protein
MAAQLSVLVLGLLAARTAAAIAVETSWDGRTWRQAGDLVGDVRTDANVTWRKESLDMQAARGAAARNG